MASRLEVNPIRTVQIAGGALFLCDVCSGAWGVDDAPFHNPGCTYRDCPGCGEPAVGAGVCEFCRAEKEDAPLPSDVIELVEPYRLQVDPGGDAQSAAEEFAREIARRTIVVVVEQGTTTRRFEFQFEEPGDPAVLVVEG